MSKKNTINEARKPADKEIGRHILKGLRFDSNGNPLYTCDTFSNEVAKAIGWRFSPKYGLYGQFPIVSDPTIFNESKKQTVRLTESELKMVINESVKKIINEAYYGAGGEMMYDDGDFNNRHYISGENPFAGEEPKGKVNYDYVLESGREAFASLRQFMGVCVYYGVNQNEKYQDMYKCITPTLNLIDSILNDKELQ